MERLKTATARSEPDNPSTLASVRDFRLEAAMLLGVRVCSARRRFMRHALPVPAGPEVLMAATRKARAIGFNHVALEVGDIDQALAFYGRLFDFELRDRSATDAFIDLGDQF